MALPSRKHRAHSIADSFPKPEDAFDSGRQQYESHAILNMILDYTKRKKDANRVLGIVDLDVFVPGLNFVFGEAECPGKASLISLFKLKPEFYRFRANMPLLVERATKEAIHELGHTLGLMHCSNPFCVMHFSNSIFATDRKQTLFCNKCQLKAESASEVAGEET